MKALFFAQRSLPTWPTWSSTDERLSQWTHLIALELLICCLPMSLAADLHNETKLVHYIHLKALILTSNWCVLMISEYASS